MFEIEIDAVKLSIAMSLFGLAAYSAAVILDYYGFRDLALMLLMLYTVFAFVVFAKIAEVLTRADV